MVSAERAPDMVAMGGMTDLTEAHQGLAASTANIRRRSGRAARSTASSTAFPASPSSTGCTTGRTGSRRPASPGRPRHFAELTDIAVKLTDPAKNRYGFGMRGGAGGQSAVHGHAARLRARARRRRQGRRSTGRRRSRRMDLYSGLYTKLKVCPPSAPNDGYRQIMEAFKTGQTGDDLAPHRLAHRDPAGAEARPVHDRHAPGRARGALCAHDLPVQRHHGSAQHRCRLGLDRLLVGARCRRSRCSRRPATSRPIPKSPRTSGSPRTRSTRRPSRPRPIGQLPPPLSRQPGLGGDRGAARVPEDPGRPDHGRDAADAILPASKPR